MHERAAKQPTYRSREIFVAHFHTTGYLKYETEKNLQTMGFFYLSVL